MPIILAPIRRPADHPATKTVLMLLVDFVARWDGSGVDPELVDIEALRAEWEREPPYPQSYVLLQRA